MGRRARRRCRRADEHDIQRARDLRRTSTTAEQMLWQLLRNRWVQGFKFRRQQPLGPYFADFYCAACALVVELDGASHTGRGDYDAHRTQWLESRGIRVIRFRNLEVEQEPRKVLQIILDACRERVNPWTMWVTPHPPLPQIRLGEGEMGRSAGRGG
jgi:very-short-patch-repair endonuclease